MFSSIFKKVLADLWSNKARSILVVLSIAVGVFAVGIVVSSFSIVKKDMAADFWASNPHSARIYTSDFDASVLDSLRAVPGIEAVEARYNIWVQITASNGNEYPINVDSINQWDEIGIDKLVDHEGSPNLKEGEIYLERQGAEGLGVGIGDLVVLVLNNGDTRSLKVVGTVHDVHANPFLFSSKTSGYVTPSTMAEIGGSDLNNYISLISAGSQTDEVLVRKTAERVAEKLTSLGILVYNINAANPGQHPAQTIIDTVLLLMGALSILVIFLSAFLVTNTISALMGQQVRQIGVMKAVGATMGQVVGVYLGLAAAYGVLSLLVGIPLSAIAAYGLTRWLIGMLNATPSGLSLPIETIGVQLLIGLVIPVVGALIPVLDGARRTVRESITSYGISGVNRKGVFDRVIERIPRLPRPLMLSLRNTFRRKGRLILTLVTLMLGGAIFISMFGVRESLYSEIDQTQGYYQADVNVEFVQPYPIPDVLSSVDRVPGVLFAEGWNTIRANVIHADGISTDQIIIYAPPVDSQFVDPVMIAGRWLEPGDDHAIVVSNHFTDLRPDVEVGDKIQVLFEDRQMLLTVVGIFRVGGTFPSPFTYTSPSAFESLTGIKGMANGLRILTEDHSLATQDKVLDAVKNQLTDSGYSAKLQTGAEIIFQQRSEIDLLVKLLLAMGLLIALVGGLGLMGTMGMNILERTREIGVMRSIGAINQSIFGMMVTEGVLIGMISWALSAIAAIPITQMLDKALGNRLMTIPIIYIFSWQGLWIWLVFALVLSAASSLLPARTAVRLTVRDILAYE